MSQGNASEKLRRAVHWAVGCSVTLKWTTRRRAWVSTMKTKRTLKETVGTTKKSVATRSFTWLSRNARQVGDGGFLGRTMYFSTVDLLTAMLSLGELAHDAWGTPARIRHRHLADEVPEFLGNRGPAGSPSGEAGPVVSEPSALPGDHGARLDEHERAPPAGPGPREPRPEEAVGGP